MIDQLAYAYAGGTNASNQLLSVTDATSNNSGLVSGTTGYTWDNNGNMLGSTATTNTQNKAFTYNLLNLPATAITPSTTATYTYDATGNKLRKVDLKSGATTTTDYINGIEYDNSTTTIGFIQTEEGKAVPTTTGGYDYTYYLGDNLGNTRVTFDTQTGVAFQLQRDDYYAFGMEINTLTTSPKNEYLYNKKELQEELQEYDYGARFYDPVIARWNTIDPLAEKGRRWSIYNYVEDDPIRLTDPDGMNPSDFHNQDGTTDHVDDNSTAQYKEVGKGHGLHYEFTGFNKNQGGDVKNEVNLGTAIEKQELLNESNPALKPAGKETFCNYGLDNLIKTVISATDNSSGLKGLLGEKANQMFTSAFNNSAIQNVSLDKALGTAAFGGFSFGLYYNPKCTLIDNKFVEGHGHAVGFAVGQGNAIKGNVANIGTHNTFESIGSFPASMQKNFMYYILAPSITPKHE